ncbi:DUF6036 family nucleotidyltransferase [Kocuria sp. CPCC 205292]|uniref:DUF6036 family nucleotidyltransferase n=1 Tax=Kocuria cellulosilytica TaxID=3071451 RepID=UPI0034D67571
MHRYQLEHAIRAACSIIRRDQVIIVGSQSILGSFHEDDLPDQATMSTEIDILPMDDDPQTVLDLSDELSAVAGEWSDFDQMHGFFLDGVDDMTAKLPAGWRERLVAVSNENTRQVGTGQQFTGLCLDKEDLCVAKLLAYREKDQAFVGALLQYQIVDREVIIERLHSVQERWPVEVGRALGWLQRGT